MWRVNRDGEREDSFEVDAGSKGSGIEGLAFDRDGSMLVADEKPARITVLDAEGALVDRIDLEFADDLSALAWNAEDQHLYALSDEEHALFRLDRDFRKITKWKLPIDHPEGIAFDGSTVFIASDSEERLYVFALD